MLECYLLEAVRKNSETNQHIVDLVSVVDLGFYLPLWYRYLPIAPFANVLSMFMKVLVINLCMLTVVDNTQGLKWPNPRDLWKTVQRYSSRL